METLYEMTKKLLSQFKFGSSRNTEIEIQAVGWSSIASLISDLEAISSNHEEIFDTDVRESLASFLHERFITYNQSIPVPNKFGMFTDEADLLIKKVFLFHEHQLDAIIETFNLDTIEKRATSFTNSKVKGEKGLYLEDFFGAS